MTDQTNLLLKKLSEVKDDRAINPDLEFKLQARGRILQHARTRRTKNSSIPFLFKPVGLALTCCLIFLLVGSSTIFAAQSALPNSPLYPLKLESETVAIKTAPNPYWKGQLALDFTDRRIKELAAVSSNPDPHQVIVVSQNYQRDLELIKTLPGLPPAEIDKRLVPQQKMLETIVKQAPSPLQPNLQNTLNQVRAIVLPLVPVSPTNQNLPLSPSFVPSSIPNLSTPTLPQPISPTIP